MEPRNNDPWEARERERMRREAWRQKKRAASSGSSQSIGSGDIISPLTWEGGFDWANNALPLGLLVAVALLLLASVPFDGLPGALLYRSFFTKAGSILLLFLAIVGGGGVGKGAWRDVWRGPHPFIVLLLIWSGVSFFLAPYRGYAALDFVRIADGIAAYFVAGYALRNRGKQAAVLTVGLLGMGCLIALGQIAEIGQAQGGLRTEIAMSRFGAHGNLGSTLLLFFPPALALAVWPNMEEKRRIAAICAALVIGSALLAERARAAWIGAAAALCVLGVCYVVSVWMRRADTTSPRRGAAQSNPFARAVGSPLIVVVIGLVLLIAFGGSFVRILGGRAATLRGGEATQGSTFQSRLVAWNGAVRMAREKPLTGWGLGAYPVMQGRWTHMGDEVESALQNGTDNESLAHNYYLQWAAETGYTGLFLYGAFAAAFVAALFVRLPGGASSYQKAIVSGALALFVGSHVDALASPAHHFHGVWTLLWTWMGLGVAALRAPVAVSGPAFGPDDGREASDTPFAKIAVWGTGFASVAVGGALVFFLAAWANRIVSEGQQIPRGTLEVVATGAGPGKAGATLAWTARFTDAGRVSQPTSPGTVWSVQNDGSLGSANIARAAQLSLYVPPLFDPKIMDYSGGSRRSEFRVLVPADAVRAAQAASAQARPQITVKATYFDAYGRKYEAWSTRALAPPEKK